MFDMFCIVFFNDEEIKCIELNFYISILLMHYFTNEGFGCKSRLLHGLKNETIYH